MKFLLRDLPSYDEYVFGFDAKIRWPMHKIKWYFS